jgi:predicted transcriptional regulator of viral defense system
MKWHFKNSKPLELKIIFYDIISSGKLFHPKLHLTNTCHLFIYVKDYFYEIQMKNKAEIVIDSLKKRGIMATREIQKLGVSRQYIRNLNANGRIERIARGFYMLPDQEFSEMQSIVEVSKQVPKGVFCLLSALRIHNFTTQNPFQVWIAIERRAWKPQTKSNTQVRYVRFSGQAFTSGVEVKNIGGIEVKVYSAAKTVADCFKYRNKTGLDVALEALREGWKNKLFTMDELWKYAIICRVENIMRPYLESMVSL